MQWVADTLTAGGGWALAAIMLVENVFPPIPSEAVLPLAGFLVDEGSLSLVEALTMSTTGSVTGALLLYAVGRWGGRPLLYRWRGVLRLSEEELDRADAWFDTHGPKLVFWCRMVPLARSAISVPAGAAEMPAVRFLLLTTAGTLAWNAVLIGAGVALGRNWESIARATSTYSNAVIAALTIAGVVVVVRLVRR